MEHPTSSRCSFALLWALLLLQVVCTTASTVFNCVGGTVTVSAHQDDDLLFMSPDLLGDFSSNSCLTSLYLTAGDAGAGLAYAESREEGSAAAFAHMAASNNTWTSFEAVFGGQNVLVQTLVEKPNVQRVMFRLPDGQVGGEGDAATGYQSLRRLYFGDIPTISSIDGEASFTLSALRDALGQILAARQPTTIRTLDHLSDYDAGDHSDHLTTARLTKEAAASYAAGATVNGYMGYPVEALAPTLSTTDTLFTQKCDAFFSYTPYDYAECQSFSACSSRGESSWLQRQYIVTPELAVTSTVPGDAETPAVLPSGTNIAGFATVTASSYAPGQPPSAVNDGNIGGYPGNDTAEWSSDAEGAGAWVLLSFPQPIVVGGIVVYDRPNSNDWLTAGRFTFSDNSTLDFTVPINDGSANVISLPRNYTTTSVLLTVTSVASTTQNVGLAELQIYGTVCSTCSVSSSSSSSSSKSSSTKKTTTTAASSTTSLPVSTTSSSTASSAVPTSSVGADLALSTTATASSWNAATDQTPAQAIDGVISGYKEDGSGDYTKEWASSAEGAGAWLKLVWSSPVTANRIVLYDRPNLLDQITGGTLTFSDNSTLAVPALNNDGSATTLDFSTRTFSSLTLTVTSVASTGQNTGLSEIQVYLVLGASTTSVASSTTVVSASQTSSLPVSTSASSSSSRSTVSFSSSTSASASATSTSSSSVVSTSTPSSSSSSSSRSVISFSSSSTSSPSSSSRSTSTTATTTTVSSSSTAVPTTWNGLNDLARGYDSYLASSYGAATDQGPEKALDGVVSGYKADGSGDYTKEWATNGEGVGAYLIVSWPESITANQLVLFDRPNLNDQILNASIYFNDGSTIYSGPLDNAGGATYLNFTAKTFDSLMLQVLAVSSTTSNVGLSELMLFNNPAALHHADPHFPVFVVVFLRKGNCDIASRSHDDGEGSNDDGEGLV
ncbi:hypothetical protein JCM8097_001467 [Rhodosporidiobolus ruineniae]